MRDESHKSHVDLPSTPKAITTERSSDCACAPTAINRDGTGRHGSNPEHMRQLRRQKTSNENFGKLLRQQHQEPNEDCRLINRRQLRKLIPVSAMTIWRWERAGLFPQHFLIGRTALWKLSDVLKIIEDSQ